MNTKTMEGIVGAKTNMNMLNTPMRVYREARRPNAHCGLHCGLYRGLYRGPHYGLPSLPRSKTL